jgi:hypothetical protein
MNVDDYLMFSNNKSEKKDLKNNLIQNNGSQRSKAVMRLKNSERQKE